MQHKIKKVVAWSFIYILEALMVTYGWQFLEILFYGEITHRIVDDVMGNALALSLFLNTVFIIHRCKKKYSLWFYKNHREKERVTI